MPFSLASLHSSPRAVSRCALRTLLVCVAALLSGCDNGDRLAAIQRDGVLKIITRNGPTTYYEDRNGPTGFEYALAQKFAEYLGVELVVQVDYGIADIFTALNSGRADIAAAGLTITPERQRQLWFSRPYMTIEQWLLYRNDRHAPTTVADLVNSNIRVIANSSHEEFLRAMVGQHHELTWIGSRDVETVDLLDQLADGEIDFTVVDSNEYLANRGFYPRIKQGFSIGEPGQMAWVIAQDDRNRALLETVNEFFETIEHNGELDELIERFYGNSEQNTAGGSLWFSDNVETILPLYRDLIENVANEYAMDWQLLAAISYQESHWNPRATSPTGVRGFMMLTRATAKEMGVKNRVNVEQSLRGGARYFKSIYDRIPAGITEPDRRWFALAAYNVGLGHVEDARVIAETLKKDPNKWTDVKEMLPLLRKKKWYQGTKHGYARGEEPVTYVQNIRHYYNVLTWSDVASTRTPPPTDIDQLLPQDLRESLEAL